MNTQTNPSESSAHVHSLIGVMAILKTRPRRAAVLRIGESRMNVQLLRSGFIAFNGAVPSAVWERELEIDIARADSIVEPSSAGELRCTQS